MTAVCSSVDMVINSSFLWMGSFPYFAFNVKRKKLGELDFSWETRTILVPEFPLTDPYVLWIKFS